MDTKDIRWLTPSEQGVWRSFLLASRLVYSRCERDLLESAAMTMTQYGILVMLSEAEGGTMRMSDIAVASHALPSSVTHAVSRMEKAGWIDRVHCPSDRRGWLAAITPAGHAALEEAAPGHVESVRRALFDRLSPDQAAQLGEIGRAILDNPRDGGEVAGVGDCEV